MDIRSSTNRIFFESSHFVTSDKKSRGTHDIYHVKTKCTLPFCPSNRNTNTDWCLQIFLIITFVKYENCTPREHFRIRIIVKRLEKQFTIIPIISRMMMNS